MKKCPPGVICIENFTSLIMCVILFIVGYFIYVSLKQSNKQQGNNSQDNNSQGNNYQGTQEIVLQPSWPYNNLNLIYKDNARYNYRKFYWN